MPQASPVFAIVGGHLEGRAPALQLPLPVLQQRGGHHHQMWPCILVHSPQYTCAVRAAFHLLLLLTATVLRHVLSADAACRPGSVCANADAQQGSCHDAYCLICSTGDVIAAVLECHSYAMHSKFKAPDETNQALNATRHVERCCPCQQHATHPLQVPGHLLICCCQAMHQSASAVSRTNMQLCRVLPRKQIA